MHNTSSLKLQINQEARRLGFFHAGVALASTTPRYDLFTRWLADGFHGDMAYLARQSLMRRDPRSVFPGTRSVLVLGMDYFVDVQQADSPLKGRISRYAWGEDYHDILRERLESLLQFIRRKEPSAQGRCYVDTGPIMEKAWGAETTLGWIGKNTSLISRRRGSWFFLGIILLDVPLEPDIRENSYCGTCSRCLDACPTGAITDPYALNAGICISYLTIEHRGPVPRHLRPLIGNRILGCDECQEVCPWNRFACETEEKRFLTQKNNTTPDLIPLVGITHSEFKQRFQNSPIYRATRDGFVRNVVTALGNSGQSAVLPVLEKALRDKSALVRSTAAWSLGRVSPEWAKRIFSTARKHEYDPLVLEDMDAVLGRRNN